ncbi:MAG: dTDP-glucose 4,6-dehydratase [Actinobacteria bacterium]|nr:dTDP-glucose 4,6-dehydratase [Actinomycetota bacterium]
MTKVLVTGAAGFIGSNYVRHVLATSDVHVTILDSLTYAGGTDTIADILAPEGTDISRVHFIKGDICDRDLVEEVMPGHQRVVNFAAESHVDRSIVDPDAFIKTNCLGTNVLCDVATKSDVERFVHVSTDEVYGSRIDGSFVETDLLEPSSPYSASKAGSDLIALGYHNTFGLNVSVTRASNNYGPFQYPEKLIPLFVTNLMRGRSVPLYGDGSNIRDWLYVSDHCAAVEAVVQRGEAGEIYNIGGSAELTNRELTWRLLELCDADESLVEHVPDRLGHDQRYSISLDKIASLGWEPQVSVDEGLALTVVWYRDNVDWWQTRRP